MCVFEAELAFATEHIRRSEDNLLEFLLSCHHVDSGDQTGCQAWWQVLLPAE